MKAFFIFCGTCCFFAIVNWPIEYYTFLRIIVSLGSIVAVYYLFTQKTYLLAIIFILIFILFNPILPIYLYKKSFWLPFDILTGVLFYLLTFFNKKKKIITNNPAIKAPLKSYTRDRIISPKKLKL
ncbi:DUF6804 family protein [Pedobacter ureilyticus]|uniref:DUF6804 family protein n=1 Tax=Pedobacter ureilyticus TaxID=1393051 RepID=A0ABW9J1N1_9SPHI